ncbi:MAG: O-antigen ligase family protein [Flavobacteriaceae bacterium]
MILILFPVFEVSYGIFAIIIFLFASKLSKNLINISSYLILIILIATISSFFQDKTSYNFIKDVAYFTKPILAIIAGYLLAKQIKTINRLLKNIIFVTAILSIIHLIKILTQVDFSTDSISEIRKFGGYSNLLQVFALTILIGSYKYKFLDVFKSKLLKRIVLITITTSFILYFSRTMVIAFLILGLSVFGYLKLTQKGVKYASITILCIGLFYVYLFNSNIERDKPGIESFLYKMKIAPSEIFSLIDKKRMSDHAYLWDHWRAYEATMAIEQINTVPTFIAGKGLGALVDLKMSVFLGGEKMRYIPKLHNGYVNLFFKSGILGVVIYLLFLINLYIFVYSKSKKEESKVINNLIGGIGVYFIFSSLIINGIYNVEDLNMFILGFLFFLRKETNYLKEKVD